MARPTPSLRTGGMSAAMRWLICAIFLALAGGPALGQKENKVGGTPAFLQDLSPEEADAAIFTLGNAIFILYHEFGHALLDVLQIPAVGLEEDIVDSFASLRMISAEPDELKDALVMAVARGWLLYSKEALKVEGGLAFQSEHGLDQQRYYDVLCFFAGSGPEARRQVAIDAGLPKERLEECSGYYERTRDGWARLLEPHAPNASRPVSRLRVDETEGGITIVYNDVKKKGEAELVELLKNSGLVELVVEDVMSLVALPKDLTAELRPCTELEGEDGAFYDSEALTVVLCSGRLDLFHFLLESDMDNGTALQGVQYPRIFPDLTREEELVAIFLLGNTVFAVYRQLAIALVQDLDMPIVESEEDVADVAAAVALIPDGPNDLSDLLVDSVATGWLMAAEMLDDRDLEFWSGNRLDAQRHHDIICLFVGSDIEGLGRYAAFAGLDQERRDFCIQEYALLHGRWASLLTQYGSSTGSATAGTIGVVYEEPANGRQEGLRDLVRESGLAEEAADNMQNLVELPRNLQVVFKDCKDEDERSKGAFFDADGGRAVVCYSFLSRVEKMGSDAVADGRFGIGV